MNRFEENFGNIDFGPKNAPLTPFWRKIKEIP